MYLYINKPATYNVLYVEEKNPEKPENWTQGLLLELQVLWLYWPMQAPPTATGALDDYISLLLWLCL